MLDEVIYLRVSTASNSQHIVSKLFESQFSPSKLLYKLYKWNDAAPALFTLGEFAFTTHTSVSCAHFFFLPWQNQQEGPLFSGFTSKITLTLKYWDPDESSVWGCFFNCSEMSRFISKMGWGWFFFFFFPTVGGRLTSSERTFIKRTHESAAYTFKDVVKHPTPTGLFRCFFFFFFLKRTISVFLI